MGGAGGGREGLKGSQFLEGDCRGRRWVTFNRLKSEIFNDKKVFFSLS